ncbi:Putative inner membrane protein [Enterobacter cancerogenus]|uniref:Inner membrane protein n=1 Tax=Enterobacter cancerogenus TaxID=69218 RepID=A0A484XYV3_9ENTR|nr:Putative inner membrane protein [Enterobacter cancerogenus]
MMGAGNASGRFLGPLIILSAMTASIPIGVGSLLGALLFYIWAEAELPAAPSSVRCCWAGCSPVAL